MTKISIRLGCGKEMVKRSIMVSLNGIPISLQLKKVKIA